MPRPPDWIDKVNYIVDFWIDPCNAPVIVYIELAAAPAGHALLAWFAFDVEDVLRGYLRPSAALGSNTRGRRGKAKRPRTRIGRAWGRIGVRIRKVPGLGDDLGNWIGKNLPGAQAVKGRAISQGERFLWIIDDLAQRALLALLIADILIDFMYEWATLVAESEYCKRERQDSLYATGPGTPTGFLVQCFPADSPVTVWQAGAVGWNGNVGTCGPGQHALVSAMGLQSAAPVPVEHWQRFTIQDDAGFRIEESSHQTIQPGASAESVGTVHLTGSGSVVISHCAIGGGVNGTSHDVTIFGGPLA